ncbi:MAG: PspC domain-containing protein [Anaerolineae bacterium]|nr:PspC domain-containing protein [Anaerolineae bacterium]
MSANSGMERQTRVARSLVDRVLGGVCGGLSAYLGINPWWARALTVILTVLTGGVAALLYLILWWTLPADLTPGEPVPGRDLGRLLLVGLLIALGGAVALARGLGLLTSPQGADLFWPGVIVVVGLTLLWREWRS